MDAASISPDLPDTRPALEARRHPTIARVADGWRRAIAAVGRPELQRNSARAILAVSGGADSLAFLIAAAVLRQRSDPWPEPIIAHVHHHLRGAAADADAECVEAAARRFGLRYARGDVFVDPAAGNIEAEARRQRYVALRAIAAEYDAPFIATAHHADDQLETLLMRLARGTAADGLRGIHQVLPGKTPHDATILRPLLSITHADLVDLCSAAGVRWQHDQSNDDRDRDRAFLRGEVIPHILRRWPEAARRAASCAALLQEARVESFDASASSRSCDTIHLQWKRTRASTAHAWMTLLRQCVATTMPPVVDRLTHEHLRSAAERIVSDDRDPARFSWPGGLTLAVTSHDVVLTTSPEYHHAR